MLFIAINRKFLFIDISAVHRVILFIIFTSNTYLFTTVQFTEQCCSLLFTDNNYLLIALQFIEQC